MTKEEKLLIKVNALFSFVLALAGIFLSVFLFKLGGFQSVALFYLVTLIALFFAQGDQFAVAKTWILIIPIFPLAIGILQFYLLKLDANRGI